MGNPLISVIIPVYNVRDYLTQCLDSVVAQTYKNVEIILVDDGSTDDSGRICDEYSMIDKRINVIHKENGGLSDARNVALDIIKGEYITFIDSDDWVSRDYIERLYNIASKESCDLTICSGVKIVNNIKKSRREKNKNAYIIFTSREAMLNMLYKRKCGVYAWGKLYRACLFDTLRFPKGKLYEDVPTTWNIMKKVNNVGFVDGDLYFYRQRSDSIVHQKVTSKSLSRLDAIDNIMDEVSDDEKLYKAAVTFYIFTLFDLYAQADYRNKKINDFLKEKIKLYRKIVFNDRESAKLFRIMAGLSYCSFNAVKISGRLYKQFLYLYIRFL